MRANLKQARQAAGLTQKQVAEYLGISERYYQHIESGERNGDFALWDMVEDLFTIHQRELRKNFDIRSDRAGRPVKYQKEMKDE